MQSDDPQNRLTPLQETLRYRFKDIHLLSKALTHKSYVNEKTESLKHNERFEFLGDSVLDLIVSDYMVKKYSQYSEGALSKIRASVVNENCLAHLARKIDLGQYLLLGRGEDLSGGRNKNSLLANAFEAVVGAVYFDSDLQTAYGILMPLLEEEIERYADTCQFRDYKSDLQEYTQNKLVCVPSYRVVKESGPDHDKRFEVAVIVREETLGRGVGRSKKEAEQAAAKMALEKINGDTGKTVPHGP
ncbi:MAG: ribonuclease III [Nitrospinae bacterium]|nr:ribonuclease III [Nitrospinota bacterium]